MLYTNEGEIKMLGESSEVLADIVVIAYTVCDAMVCAGTSKSQARANIMKSVIKALNYYDEETEE